MAHEANFDDIQEAFEAASIAEAAAALRSTTPACGPRLARIQSHRDAADDSSVVSGRPPKIVEGPDASPPDSGLSVSTFNDTLESTMQRLENNGRMGQSEIAASALASQQEIAALNLRFESLLDGNVTQ